MRIQGNSPFTAPGKMAFLVGWVLALSLWGCETEQPLPGLLDAPFTAELPPGVPPMPVPEDNPMTRKKIALGKQLFYDPILSRDSTISCGSCHDPAFGMGDNRALSLGIHGREGFRNAPALFNLAWHERHNKDGGTPTLETQFLVPISDPAEMDHSVREAVIRLQEHPEYRRLFREVFQTEPSAFGLSRALGAFQRSLLSFGSPYDRYRWYGETDALSPAAQNGLDLFFSDRLNCSGCHSNFDFRTAGWENNGLYLEYADSGRGRVTLDPADAGRFKVPSLRNLVYSAPYMHDGSLATLSEVVDHYASGGAGHPNQSPLVSGFVLSAQEKNDLIAFLESLSDPSFVSNPDIQPFD